VFVQVAMSGTGTVFHTVQTDTVWTSGAEQRTSRSGRPLVVESHDGQKNVRFQFDGSIFGNTFVSSVIVATYNCEIVELNVD
jgi:hypothetical protein